MLVRRLAIHSSLTVTRQNFTDRFLYATARFTDIDASRFDSPIGPLFLNLPIGFVNTDRSGVGFHVTLHF